MLAKELSKEAGKVLMLVRDTISELVVAGVELAYMLADELVPVKLVTSLELAKVSDVELEYVPVEELA